MFFLIYFIVGLCDLIATDAEIRSIQNDRWWE